MGKLKIMLITSLWYLLSISNVSVDQGVAELLLLSSADVWSSECDTGGSNDCDSKVYNFWSFDAM